MDIDTIRQRLPHRYPFLLIDKVTEISKEHIRALKNVTVNEPFFQGHFPEKPVMPGVLMIESMAQAVGLLHQETYPSGLGFLVGVDEARIRRQVVPGDQLILEAEIVRQRPRLCKAQAKATVNGEVVAEAVISLISDDDA
jgi:3-hydroxyacyl-[acyl-carrier-protein] dehydratase